MVESPWTSSSTSSTSVPTSVMASNNNTSDQSDQSSQPPVIHRTVLQRQCSLGGRDNLGGHRDNSKSISGICADQQDQCEVEPVASLSCISTSVPVVKHPQPLSLNFDLSQKGEKPSSLLMTSSRGRGGHGGRGVFKRAMTLPVEQEDHPSASGNSRPSLIQLGPQFNYTPLRSPMRTSKPLVPNSETSETLLDIPILITSSDVNPEDEEEDEAKEMEEIKASSLPSVMSLFYL